MSKQWEAFEKECTEYLNTNLGSKANFIHQGKSDSTIPDILVECKNGNSFYIEAKHSPAQCGQFVLLPNIATMQFEYSKDNSTPFNNSTKIIMDYMNRDFEGFKEAGTAGKDITVKDSQEVFSSWIIDVYKSKNVQYFITNDFTIIPINDICKHFSFSAKYRIKRSGSSEVPKKLINTINCEIERLDLNITKYVTEGKHSFVYSSNELHNTRFYYDGYEYMLSKL